MTTIVRTKNPFTSVPNELLRDESLSIEARAALCIMASYGDKWKLRQSHLMKVFGVGKDKYQRIIRELKESGRLTVNPAQGPDGKLTGYEWIIDFEAGKTGGRENRQPVQPVDGSPGYLEKNKGMKEQDKKEIDHSCSSKPDQTFDFFWHKWPLAKVGKAQAKRNFMRLSKQDQRFAIEACEQWCKKWRAAHPDANSIHPGTYLSGKRWEDEFGSQRAPQSAKAGQQPEKDVDYFKERAEREERRRQFHDMRTEYFRQANQRDIDEAPWLNSKKEAQL